MPEDTQTVRFDPTNSFDVLQRLGAASDRLGASGARAGEGFVRGERVIRTASANIAASLLSSGDAATTLLVAMSGLERVFKIGILPTIGVAAGVAIFEVFHRQVERTNEAAKALGEELKKALSTQIKLSAADLGSDIEAVTTKMEGLKKETESTTTSILKFFGAGQGFGGTLGGLKAGIAPTTPAAFGADKEEELAQAAERRRKLLTAQADLELRIAQTKEDALSQDKESQDIAKAKLEFSQKEAKLLEDVRAKGISQTDFTTRLKALEITREAAIAQAHITAELDRQNALEKSLSDQESRRLRALKQQQDTAKQATDFFSDVGSGKFAEAFKLEQIDKERQQRGRELIDEIERGQAAGFFQDPLSQAELKEARRIADRIDPQSSIHDLVKTDFSNLLELSKYDFSGLQPLSGLTINIQ